MSQPAPVLRISEENDYLDFRVPAARRPDDNYTQGLRVSVSSTGLNGWRWLARRLAPTLLACGGRPAARVPAAPKASCGTTIWEVGQLLFTPTREDEVAISGERPHAGWLYGRMVARVEGPRTLLSGTLTAGVTGPPSLAASTQNAFHHLVGGFRHPVGWDQQLPTEVAGSLRLEVRRLVATLGTSVRRYADLTAAISGEGGTLNTALASEVQVRAGLGLAHPWRTRERPRSHLGLFGTGALRARLVAHNLFLDGSTYVPSLRVEKVPLSGEWEWGLGIRVARVSAEYRLVGEGREYRTGPRLHPVGQIAMTLLR